MGNLIRYQGWGIFTKMTCRILAKTGQMGQGESPRWEPGGFRWAWWQLGQGLQYCQHTAHQSRTVFADWTFKEVVKVKWGHYGWVLKHMTVFGDRVFAEVLKLKWGPWSNLTGVLVMKGNLNTQKDTGDARAQRKGLRMKWLLLTLWPWTSSH